MTRGGGACAVLGRSTAYTLGALSCLRRPGTNRLTNA